MIEKMCFGGNRREFLFALLPSFCQEIRPSREKFYVPVRVGCWPLRARVDGNRSPSTSTPTKPTGTPPREIALSTWAAKIATVEFPTLTRRAQCVKSAPNVCSSAIRSVVINPHSLTVLLASDKTVGPAVVSPTDREHRVALSSAPSNSPGARRKRWKAEPPQPRFLFGSKRSLA